MHQMESGPRGNLVPVGEREVQGEKGDLVEQVGPKGDKAGPEKNGRHLDPGQIVTVTTSPPSILAEQGDGCA